MKRIGVLALQGDFEAHAKALVRAGAENCYIRTSRELASVDALVIPGGESTTMLRLMEADGMLEALEQFGRRKPIFGTCAGAILLAREVSNPPQASLGLVDIGVERNAYGRQLDSRVARIQPAPEFQCRTQPGELEAVFIRAPIIRRVGTSARVLASYNGDPVLVAQGQHLVATFHPELTDDPRVHQYFFDSL
jgi:5'-phosphate synthase pdxT subunit